ncbi:hypothetical protein KY290_024304 [Solanum tuberosum]|uniref:Uncharacterized protein n=1 Tax=Solanum tuberosum TaxID=4113 RepID=A0ABQ7UQC3_SOLTU|nr:hypothetical protein KY290_024304 [Solanum tuberosum]
MPGEEATSIENIAVQFFNGHPQGEKSERYVNTIYLDRVSSEQIHEIESEISVDEVIPDVECEKSYGGENHDEGVLQVVSVTEIAFSMKFCQGCSTIVMDEFKEILKTSSFYIANTFIDQLNFNSTLVRLTPLSLFMELHQIAMYGIPELVSSSCFEQVDKPCLLGSLLGIAIMHPRVFALQGIYNADGLLVSAPYEDVHEGAKHSLENDNKLPWTYHTICHVYRQCDCCYKEAVLSETNCSTAWSPLSSLICTHNKWCIALYYMEKSGMKLPYSFTGVFLPSNLVKQMVVPRIGFRTAGSFYLSVRLNADLIQANVEILAAPGSSSLLRICYIPLEVAVELQSVIFSSLFWLNLNLEDKVFISEGSIVVNTAGQAIRPKDKPQRVPRIRQSNTSFAWDPD